MYVRDSALRTFRFEKEEMAERLKKKLHNENLHMYYLSASLR